MSKLNVLNKFQRTIYNYISDYQPQMLEDAEIEDIIVSRADNANKEYLRLIKAGVSDYEALEQANEVLHTGLEFSPISFIQDAYAKTKGLEIDDKKAIEIYNNAKDIFLSIFGIDEFDEEMLLAELIPFLD